MKIKISLLILVLFAFLSANAQSNSNPSPTNQPAKTEKVLTKYNGMTASLKTAQKEFDDAETAYLSDKSRANERRLKNAREAYSKAYTQQMQQ